MTSYHRTLGSRPLDAATTEFRVWAPNHERVALLLSDTNSCCELERDADGYFSTVASDAPAGTRYRYLVGDERYADPASRSQPDGVHGPSQVVDLAAHRWNDGAYSQRPLWDHVIYELHVGTYSLAGTFAGALEYLDSLIELGVSAVQIMPVAQFPGARNWGYDGVFPFAVQNSYGGPLALQHFVDVCHQRGLAVILDVVYNHLGPEGNILGRFGPYFSDRYRTPWGDAINFDGEDSDEVRDYFWCNARQWFEDFHVDALRLDAIQSIVDPSAIPFVAELAQRSHNLGDELDRRCDLIAESAANDPRVVTPREDNGLSMDAQWNDDFHHALHVALTGERTGYYVDYCGVDDLARALDEGFALQGTESPFRHRRHGAPSGHLPPDRFVVFSQNHDQIGNRALGDRLTTLLLPEQVRLAAALVILSPNIPLLFMGEEYGERSPFPYFVDLSDPTLIEAVRAGRARDFQEVAGANRLLDPSDATTFDMARLDHSLRDQPDNRALFEYYEELIEIRRSTPALRRSSRSQARAWANGNVVTLARSHDEGDVVAFFNVGASTEEANLPANGHWKILLASTPSFESPTTFALDPWSFCVFRSAATR
ncbi:MAG: malto-oligosyltrehalose trehalohydrolase [Acidimicrobiales bacterium]